MTTQARDVFTTAMDMERAGAEFYRAIAETHSGEGGLGEFFSFMAAEEEHHLEVFEASREAIPDFSYSGYDAPVKGDLQAFARVFSRARLADERKGLTDLLSAVDFAVRREMDSIFFYTEILRHVPGPQKGRIISLIEEERKHFRELTELRSHIAREG